MSGLRPVPKIDPERLDGRIVGGVSARLARLLVATREIRLVLDSSPDDRNELTLCAESSFENVPIQVYSTCKRDPALLDAGIEPDSLLVAHMDALLDQLAKRTACAMRVAAARGKRKT